MKRILLLLFIAAAASPLSAQKVDSIYFHLYTDSLKKGQHNYINVDGKLSNGRWLPLSTKEIDFSCASAKFEGNELVIPEDYKPASVTVKAVLKSNRSIRIEKTIWIKQLPDRPLSIQDEIIKSSPSKKTKKRNR